MLAPNSLMKIKVLTFAQLLRHVQLFMTPWTGAHQAPLSMGFSRQENYRESILNVYVSMS